MRTYENLLETITKQAEKLGLEKHVYGKLKYPSGTYEVSRFSTNHEKRTMIITAGWHGNERAGPETITRELTRIVTAANEKGYGLHLYPCINPSGFQNNKRYSEEEGRFSIEPRKGFWNNDFLRYVVKGQIKDQLEAGSEFDEIYMSSTFNHIRLPKETLALHKDFKTLDWKKVKIYLDLHQDEFLAKIEGHPFGKHPVLSYAYWMGGDKTVYDLLAKRGNKVVPFIKSKELDSGQSRKLKVDDHGLIKYWDATSQDYAHKRGVPLTATVETTTQTPIRQAIEYNMTWILSAMELGRERMRRGEDYL